jgi:hypothetical protein
MNKQEMAQKIIENNYDCTEIDVHCEHCPFYKTCDGGNRHVVNHKRIKQLTSEYVQPAKSMIAYKIITSQNPADLEEKVNLLLSMGWNLRGHLVINDNCASQVMTKRG